MKHNDYYMKRRLKNVKESGYSPECVALSKHYSLNVHGITLGAFGGQAKNATYKTGGTFDPKYWEQYVPGPSVAILQGDIIILNIGNDGHVCVGHNQSIEGFYCIEQNRNNTKTGKGEDAINIGYYPFSLIKNIYRKKPL